MCTELDVRCEKGNHHSDSWVNYCSKITRIDSVPQPTPHPHNMCENWKKQPYFVGDCGAEHPPGTAPMTSKQRKEIIQQSLHKRNEDRAERDVAKVAKAKKEKVTKAKKEKIAEATSDDSDDDVEVVPRTKPVYNTIPRTRPSKNHYGWSGFGDYSARDQSPDDEKGNAGMSAVGFNISGPAADPKGKRKA